jgi:peptide/nickel transport system permease protein
VSKIIKNPLALCGLIIIFIILILALFASVIAPYDPNYININSILLGPSAHHIMGTDGLGRDVFSRMLFGAQISLLVGFVAVGISTAIGIVLGSVAGFYRGWVDSIIMRFVDIMLSIPTFFLILAVIAFLTPSIWNIMIVLGIASAVLVESGLSFLGLGVQAPTASWGNILTDGKEYIQFAWWLSLFPGLAILITVLGYNLLGEGLRDLLDPKNK